MNVASILSRRAEPTEPMGDLVKPPIGAVDIHDDYRRTFKVGLWLTPRMTSILFR
jgi:hypothetical protein